MPVKDLINLDLGLLVYFKHKPEVSLTWSSGGSLQICIWLEIVIFKESHFLVCKWHLWILWSWLLPFVKGLLSSGGLTHTKILKGICCDVVVQLSSQGPETDWVLCRLNSSPCFQQASCHMLQWLKFGKSSCLFLGCTNLVWKAVSSLNTYSVQNGICELQDTSQNLTYVFRSASWHFKDMIKVQCFKGLLRAKNSSLVFANKAKNRKAREILLKK